MKEKLPAPHTLIFQVVSGKLVWLEAETEGENVIVLSSGVRTLKNDEEEHSDDQSRFKAALESISPEIRLKMFTRYDVLFTAPSQRITARYLETPPTDEENLEELIEFEVSEALQIEPDEIAWDSIRSSQHGQGEIKHLLWVATRKDYINTLLKAWPRDFYTPTRITTDLGPVYEYLLHVHPDQIQDPALLVIAEGERANLAIVTPQAIYFSRSVLIQKPNQDAEEALAAEITKTLAYVSERFPQGSIKNVIAFGFDEWDLSAVEEEAYQHGLSASRVLLEDLISEFKIDGGALTPEHVPLLCNAYCRHKLQRNGVNLIKEKPKESAWQSWVPEATMPWKQFGTIAGACVGAFIVLWLGQIAWLSYAASDRSQSGQDLLKLADRLLQEEEALQTYVRSDVHYGDVLIFLSENLPENMLVQSINLSDENGIELALSGGNQQMVVEVIEKMNNHRLFRDVTLDRAANENDGFTLYLKGRLITG